MNARLSQLIGWISLILVFALVNAIDCGSLTGVQMIWGSLLGICGLMTALLGQCLAIQRARRVQRSHVVPVRIEHRSRQR